MHKSLLTLIIQFILFHKQCINAFSQCFSNKWKPYAFQNLHGTSVPLYKFSQRRNIHNKKEKSLGRIVKASSEKEVENNDNISPPKPDWMEAELTLQNFPQSPDPIHTPHHIAICICRSLQLVDYPSESAGLKRCFPFFSWECRKTVTARRGGDTVENFVKHGELSPALQPFMGATRVELGEGTLTPGTVTRGAIMSFPVIIHGAEVLAFQHSSGMIRDRVGPPKVTRMVLRLEQVRRPPMQGCWLVKEVLDVKFAFAGDMGNSGVGG